MYKIIVTGKYNKDLKRIISKTKPLSDLEHVISLLSSNDNPLPKKYNDHALKGKYIGYRECHIKPDGCSSTKKKKTN